MPLTNRLQSQNGQSKQTVHCPGLGGLISTSKALKLKGKQPAQCRLIRGLEGAPHCYLHLGRAVIPLNEAVVCLSGLFFLFFFLHFALPCWHFNTALVLAQEQQKEREKCSKTVIMYPRQKYCYKTTIW